MTKNEFIKHRVETLLEHGEVFILVNTQRDPRALIPQRLRDRVTVLRLSSRQAEERLRLTPEGFTAVLLFSEEGNQFVSVAWDAVRAARLAGTDDWEFFDQSYESAPCASTDTTVFVTPLGDETFYPRRLQGKEVTVCVSLAREHNAYYVLTGIDQDDGLGVGFGPFSREQAREFYAHYVALGADSYRSAFDANIESETTIH